MSIEADDVVTIMVAGVLVVSRQDWHCYLLFRIALCMLFRIEGGWNRLLPKGAYHSSGLREVDTGVVGQTRFGFPAVFCPARSYCHQKNRYKFMYLYICIYKDRLDWSREVRHFLQWVTFFPSVCCCHTTGSMQVVQRLLVVLLNNSSCFYEPFSKRQFIHGNAF